MVNSLESQILTKIKKAKRGSLYFSDSFIQFGNAKSVNKALERLAKSGEIYRISTGIYVRPKIDNSLGIVLPSVDEVALAIAKRDKARVMPTGNYALYRLGMTTQVPMNIVYYTDATARKVRIGKQSITFKRVAAKSLSYRGKLSRLAVQALKSIGKDNVTDSEITTIKEILKMENPNNLKYDIGLAPAWIQKIIRSINTLFNDK